MKRFWDSNFGGQGYDAVGRRRGAPTDTPATMAPLATGRSAGGTNLGVGNRAGGRTPVGGPRAGSAQSQELVMNLQAQLKEMSTHLEGLEKERDFYFSKVGRLRAHDIIVSCDIDCKDNLQYSFETSRF